MPTKNGTDKATEAARKKAEEAKKQARISSINSEIRMLNQELGTLRTFEQSLDNQKNALEKLVQEWEEQLKIYKNDNKLSVVVFNNMFEGCCIENIRKEFQQRVNEMNTTNASVRTLSLKVGYQIDKIRTRIREINGRISVLYSELYNL